MRFTIGTLAVKAGVGVETVRYYQRRGLMRVPALDGGGAVRRYEGEDLRRLKYIRAAQAAGFTLKEISDLLALEGGATDKVKVRALALQRVAELDQQISFMTETRAALARLADQCAATQGHDDIPCPILQAFEPSGSGQGAYGPNEMKRR